MRQFRIENNSKYNWYIQGIEQGIGSEFIVELAILPSNEMEDGDIEKYGHIVHIVLDESDLIDALQGQEVLGDIVDMEKWYNGELKNTDLD